MDYNINFPHLGIYLDHVGKSIHIGGIEIAFYGIVIAFGMMLAILLAMHEAKRTGQKEEDYMDLAIFGIVFGVIGARLYYVAFRWDLYKDHPLSILNTREGGLAIYGGIIAAVITVVVFSKVKKKNMGQIFDTAAMSLVLGQIIGRWGNFFNREAFGDYTDNLFAMQLPVSAVRTDEITTKMWENIVTNHGISYIQVHPTFLYEGLWNLCVLAVLFWYRDKKKFQGELFLLYIGGYGLGRFWIEGLRTDQLLIGNTGIAVSRLLSLVIVIGVVVLDLYKRKKTK
ncbi:MAG: prolipoprotein diacylglyceryl transferase [Lachnospiraceae bacterium]|nr:prolipoprotein diacylglyceryl transferase [Lachnospiraceae bacterium]